MRSLFLNGLYGLIVRPFLRYFIGVQFENHEVLDEVEQFIIVGNHNSHFDTIAIMCALPARHRKNTYPVAANDYFGSTGIKAWATKTFVNTIMVKRRKAEGEESSLKILDQHLKERKSIIIFPEGSRGKPGAIQDFKSGIAVLLKENPEIPFVPVYLDGFGRVLPKESNIIIPLNCKVRFGKPLYADTDDVEVLTKIVKDAVLGLWARDERDNNKFATH